jgi:hypothetical protein
VGQVAKNEKRGEEVPLESKIFRKWKGVITQASRNAIPAEAFYNLENMQPIGDANIHSIPNISSSLVAYGANSIYWSQYANLNGADYLFNFATNGNVYAYNLAGGSTRINTGLPLSGSGSKLSQWKNTEILFIDSTGYYLWTGSAFSLISGTGVPSAGTDIAVFSGRVWIVQGRVLYFSGVDDYSAASWTVANGAGFINLTDPTLRSVVFRLWVQNGYLYIVGNSCINVIADVYVPSGAVPPTPIFTNLNVQALIGTDQPPSVFAMDRLMIFANRYGVYALYGVDAERISEDIDGTWQYINFAQVISGGAVVVNNILCAALLIKRLNDPVFGSNTVIALWFNKKWWFANYGALTFIVAAMQGSQPVLYGFIGNQLYQLFSDPTTAPAGIVMSALWDMDDPIADKQVIRAGFEVTVAASGALPFVLTVDQVNGTSEVLQLASPGLVAWQNNTGQIVQWVNNADAIVGWFSVAYQLYSASSPGVFAKYVGLTVNTGGAICEFSSMMMDYKKRARWQQ